MEIWADKLNTMKMKNIKGASAVVVKFPEISISKESELRDTDNAHCTSLISKR